MNQEKLRNDLQQLSGYVYKNSNFNKPQDWMEIGKSEGKKSGFYAEAFINGNDIVIAFRGTDKQGKYNVSKKDMGSDIMMGASLPPAQIINAQNYYNKIKKDFPDYNIILTGHSLGGSMAQILGSEYGNPTVTFGAYGTANLLKHQIKNSNNITNYGNAQDPFFVANIQNQVGKTLVTGDFNGDEYGVTKGNKPFQNDFDKHSIENMGDLSKAVQYRGQDLQTEESMLIKAGIEKTIDFRDIDPNRVLSNEEIGEMTQDEFLQNEEFINQQMQNGKILPKEEAERRLQAGDLVWVNAYLRDDGVEVKGYYRAK